MLGKTLKERLNVARPSSSKPGTLYLLADAYSRVYKSWITTIRYAWDGNTDAIIELARQADAMKHQPTTENWARNHLLDILGILNPEVQVNETDLFKDQTIDIILSVIFNKEPFQYITAKFLTRTEDGERLKAFLLALCDIRKQCIEEAQRKYNGHEIGAEEIGQAINTVFNKEIKNIFEHLEQSNIPINRQDIHYVLSTVDTFLSQQVNVHSKLPPSEITIVFGFQDTFYRFVERLPINELERVKVQEIWNQLASTGGIFEALLDRTMPAEERQQMDAEVPVEQMAPEQHSDAKAIATVRHYGEERPKEKTPEENLVPPTKETPGKK